MIVMGIDPGASGAIAVIREREVEVVDMPVGQILVGKTKRKRISPEMLAHDIRAFMPFDVAYIEEVNALPRQGVSSVFTFGQAHGLVLGVVASLGVRIVRVRPQLWQKTVAARGDPRPRALELYPSMVPELKRIKDEGRADAILIAHCGLMMEK
jgi:crossover junction endodeoxyribonuclease RuvC